MPPRINHHPEFRDALPPASSDRLDGVATEAVTRQQRTLEEDIGRVDRAKLPRHQEEPLYGHSFTLDDGTNVELNIEVNAAGDPVGDDREFVDARNRLAILRSRERSRGSRRFNFSFRKNRGRGPGGHGYNAEDIDGIQAQYDEQLSNFIARKIHGNGAVRTSAQATEAVSRAVIQEQKQMSALENMAAERKSGNRLLNFFRNHKKTRIAAGLALSGIGAVGIATGQMEIAIPALAARSALSATGGYLLGRTAWDGFQGWRARRQPHEDIRMAGRNNGDFSGRLTPEAAFERFVKINGAEARAGSHDARRARLAQRLGSDLVNQHYTDNIHFGGTRKPSEANIHDQVLGLHQGIINPLQEERLKSDQTQSRRRHVAGLVGGTIMAALPMVRTAGLVEIGIGGSHGHEVAAHAGPSHVTETTNTTPHSSAAGTTSASANPGNPNAPGVTVTGDTVHGPVHHVAGVPGGPTEIIINGGPGNDIVSVDTLHGASVNVHDAAHHIHQHGHGGHGGRGAGHRHVALDGATTNELHVKEGGGFISTLQDQYHLSASQADKTYEAMYGQLHGAHGTYMVGSDIRISSPGDYHLSHGARTDLEKELKKLHKMPKRVHKDMSGGTTAPPAHTGDGHTDHGHDQRPQTGGLSAPEGPSHGGASHGTAYKTDGGTTAQTAGEAGVKGATTDPTATDKITAEQLAHHLGIPLHDVYHPDTSIGHLTGEQASQAQAYITAYVHDGGFSHMSDRARSAAESAIRDYISGSIEHPGSGPYAQQAADRLHHIWMAMGHHLNNMTITQAENLRDDLAITNAG